MEIIEEAYQQNKSYVLLDRYRIEFQTMIQVNLLNEKKQREVKRVICLNRQTCLRQDRFSFVPIVSTSPASSIPLNNFGSWCPFLNGWFKLLTGKRAWLDFSKCIEACAKGIVEEAILHDSHSNIEAAYMAEKRRQPAKKTRQDIYLIYV